MNRPTLAEGLLALYAALQRRETTFGEVLAMAAKCGIDGRQVLANHFMQQEFTFDMLEA